MNAPFTVGALEPPLLAQLAGRLPVETLRRFDRIADAITELNLNSYLSDAATHRARERLVNMVRREYAIHRAAQGLKLEASR